MLRLLHLILVFLYLVLPIAAVGLAAWERRRGNKATIPALIVTAVVAFLISLALNSVYSQVTSGKISVGQIAAGTYFAAGLLLLLKLFDFGLRWSLRAAMGIRPVLPGEGSIGRTFRIFAAAVMRVGILFGVALPYVMAAGMTYRPKVLPLDDPRSQLSFAYERVEFVSSDGVKLVGWWMPAGPADRPYKRRIADWGKDTVLVCHGVGASKSNQLVLARRLVPGGFNVLAFDFRAHGESGGQLTTFGDRERCDVLGAVRYVRMMHPEESRQVFGVGASMGAAALISAAADDSDEGRAIAAIAAYAPYDSLRNVADDVAEANFLRPLDWLIRNEALPMAGAQTGTNLRGYAPANDIEKLWPRPILFIHGEKDEIIDFERGKELYDRAVQPKYYLWLPEGNHNDVVSNEAAARIVVEFLRTATPRPVI